MAGAGIGVGVGGVLSNKTGTEVGLVAGGSLAEETEAGVVIDAGLGWVLAVGGQISGAVTCEGGLLFCSVRVEVSVGLKRAPDAEAEVAADVGAVVLERIPGSGEDGFAVTVQAGDTVTGGLESTVTELREGLQEVLIESDLAGGGWEIATGMGGLWVIDGGLVETGGEVATRLGLLTEVVV